MVPLDDVDAYDGSHGLEEDCDMRSSSLHRALGLDEDENVEELAAAAARVLTMPTGIG